jgi:hypothetical protein
MANEISYTHRLNVSGTGRPSYSRTVTLSRDMAGNDFDAKTVSIPTTAAGTAITIDAAVANKGFAYFENLDGTNFVEVGVQVSATFYPLLRLDAGDYAAVRLSTGVNLFARANTASVRLSYGVFEA